MTKSRNAKVFLLILIAAFPVLGQKDQLEKSEFYRIPAEMGFAVRVNRGDSPIQVEAVTLSTNEGGQRVRCGYKIRNVGDHEVRAVEIMVITNFLFRPTGGGRLETYSEIIGFDATQNGRARGVLPGQSKEVGYFPEQNRLLPARMAEHIQKQETQIRAKFVVAAVITRVELFDGRILDYQSNADDLIKLFTEGISIR